MAVGVSAFGNLISLVPFFSVKNFSEFSQLGAGRQWDQHSWTPGSLFLKGMRVQMQCLHNVPIPLEPFHFVAVLIPSSYDHTSMFLLARLFTQSAFLYETV